MTALLYHSRNDGQTGRFWRSLRFGCAALAAVMTLAQPVFVPSAHAQEHGGEAHERSDHGRSGREGRGGEGRERQGKGQGGPGHGARQTEGSGSIGSSSDYSGAGRMGQSMSGEGFSRDAPPATPYVAPEVYSGDSAYGAHLSGEGYEDVAGDMVGTMLDAPDGAEGVIKAPEGGSGYSMTSEAEAPVQGFEPGLYGNSFLPSAEGQAARPAAAVVAGTEAASDGVMMNPEMASPEMIAPNMAVPAPAEPVAAARSTRRDLGMLAHSPVVVELFTSQGCSSCPPADDMLAGLADRPDVLALSWHVDYWDYLGWADEFAKPEFTTRQKQYARAAGERSIYTPQILIGGTDTLIDLRPAELMAMINNQLARPVALSVTAQDMGNAYQIELTPRAQMKRGVAILLVRYAPLREVEVKSGENHGLVLSYRNIVIGVDQIATWDGKVPLRLKVSDATASGASYPADTRHAILAQQVGRKGVASGAILAAVKLD